MIVSKKYPAFLKELTLVEGSIIWSNNHCWLWCFVTNILNYDCKVKITANFECLLLSMARISGQVSTKERGKNVAAFGTDQGAICWYQLENMFLS